MRLYRVATLDRRPLPSGGYEVETAHLLSLLRAGETVRWVAIPTIYNGEPSGYRALRDSALVLRTMLVRGDHSQEESPTAALAAHLRLWAPRLGLTVAFGWLIGALLPLLQPLDDRGYLLINHLGDGPDWLYAAVDPHVRNYLLITALAAIAAGIAHRSVRIALGSGATVAVSGIGADLLMQVVRMWTNRPRPEEVLGADAWLSHGRDWSHIASYPSGHLVVTAAMVVAAIVAVPALRHVLLPYLAVIAVTRILFGAHFPSDVVVGLFVGTAAGLFVAGAAEAVGAIRRPARAGRRSTEQDGLSLGPVLAGRRETATA
jgi:membrane-associated phospholipid phosphatase